MRREAVNVSSHGGAAGKYCFFDRLVAANRLGEAGWHRLYLRPGMLFAAPGAWWEAASRPRSHEGLDVHLFLNRQGEVCVLPAGSLVPVLGAGTVVTVFADFLGQSVLVAHDCWRDGAQLHVIYAHIRPEPGLGAGHDCRPGEIIGRIAPGGRGKVPPHLHLSTLWLSAALPAALTWPLLNACSAVHFCDPLTEDELACAFRPRPVVQGGWQVYILRCRDGTLYTGITTDLARRMTAHNQGRDGARYTRSRRPVRLVYSEAAASRSAAAVREWQIKRLPLQRKRALLEGMEQPEW